MNPTFFATFLCLGALVSGNSVEDGQWRGEGLAESQDNGQWNGGVEGAYTAPAAAWAAPQGSWAHGAAPLGPDGRVVDTPEVAAAKAAHLAAASGGAAWAPAAAWGGPVAAPQGSWAHRAAPLGQDGRVVDTPEVAHAKAAHQAAVSAAGRY